MKPFQELLKRDAEPTYAVPPVLDRHSVDPDGLSSLQERYLAAQLTGNRRPAQYEIGRLWQESRISVAQEHLAT